MKKILLCCLILGLSSSVFAAGQETLTAITKKSTGDFVTQLRTDVNTELAKQQRMNTELYTLKADSSCFASESAFNACFSLDWQSVDASGFNGNLTTTDDTLQEIAQKVDDLVLGAGTGVDAFGDIVALWASGNCTGYLYSDGTCGTPPGTLPTATVGQTYQADENGQAVAVTPAPLTFAGSNISYNDETGLATVPVTSTVTSGSTVPLTSGGAYTALEGKENADPTIVKVAEIDTQAEFEALLFPLPPGGTGGYVTLSAIPYSDVACTTGQYGYYGSTAYLCTGGFWTSKWTLTTHSNASPTLYNLTITAPENGNISCSDADLNTPINCGNGYSACSSTAADSAAITGCVATANSGYEFGAWSGDLTGTVYNDGAVTMTGNKSGSATFTALSSCMSGTYLFAWNGEHTSGTGYACEGDGDPASGTVTGSPTISTAVGEGGADVALMADLNNEYLTWSDSGGARIDLNGAQTLWMRVYVSAAPAGSTRLFNAEYDANNYIGVNLSTSLDVVATHKISATAPTAYGAAAISSGQWVDIAYAWDRPNQDHAVNSNGAWYEDANELASSDGTDITAIRIGPYYGFSMPANENVRVSKYAIVPGYKAAKPW